MTSELLNEIPEGWPNDLVFVRPSEVFPDHSWEAQDVRAAIRDASLHAERSRIHMSFGLIGSDYKSPRIAVNKDDALQIFIGIPQHFHRRLFIDCLYDGAASGFTNQFYPNFGLSPPGIPLDFNSNHILAYTRYHAGASKTEPVVARPASELLDLAVEISRKDQVRIKVVRSMTFFTFQYVLMHEVAHALGNHFALMRQIDYEHRAKIETLADIDSLTWFHLILSFHYAQRLPGEDGLPSRMKPMMLEFFRSYVVGRLAGHGITLAMLRGHDAATETHPSMSRIALLLRLQGELCAEHELAQRDKSFLPLKEVKRGFLMGMKDAILTWKSLGRRFEDPILAEALLQTDNLCPMCAPVEPILSRVWKDFDSVVRHELGSKSVPSLGMGLTIDSYISKLEQLTS